MTDALAQQCQEASFDALKFPVSWITSRGARRFTEHEAYQRDGADVEDGGRKAYHFAFEVPCVNAPGLVAKYGALFPTLITNLRARFSLPGVARFVHPLDGPIQALVTSWEHKDEGTRRSGPVLHCEAVEHNETMALLASPDGSVPTDSTTAAAAQAAKADADADLAAIVGYALLADDTAAALASLATGLLTFAQVTALLDALTASVDANLLAIPASPWNAATALAVHAVVADLELLRASLGLLRDTYAPAGASSRFTVPARGPALAPWQVALAVYGDASLAGLLRAANGLSGALISPGTVLLCPPVP